MKRRPRNNGVVLLVAVFVTALLAAAVIGILQMNTEEIQLVQEQIHGAEVLAIAEAGLNHALNELRKDRNWTTDDMKNDQKQFFANGYYQLTVTSGLAGVDITSRAYVNTGPPPSQGTPNPQAEQYQAVIQAIGTIQNSPQAPYTIRIDNFRINE